jgi:predicted ATPase
MGDLYLRSFSIEAARTDSYLDQVPAVRWLPEFTFRQPVTFLVGENGVGKSTLLEALAVASGFNAEGGSRNFNFATRASLSDLHERLNLVRGVPFAADGFFLRAESFYNVASEIERLDGDEFQERNYGGNLHEKSHGESFLALMMNRFHGRSLFLLDEPEAALSPSRQMALLARFHDLVEAGSQFVVATHAPILMAYPDADIIVINEEGAVRTPLRETEHYRLTREFLENPERMLHYLFATESD